MNLSSTHSRQITSRITNNRRNRTRTLSTTRRLSNITRTQNLITQRISLNRITNSSTTKPRTSTNRRRLRLLSHHILHFIRSRRNIVRHTTTRRNRQHSLSRITLSRLNSLLRTRRLMGHIMRQTRMKISLLHRITKRRTRPLTNLSHQTHRRSTLRTTNIRHISHRHRNRVNLTNTNKPSTRISIISLSHIRMTHLINTTHLSHTTLSLSHSLLHLLNLTISNLISTNTNRRRIRTITIRHLINNNHMGITRHTLNRARHRLKTNSPRRITTTNRFSTRTLLSLPRINIRKPNRIHRTLIISQLRNRITLSRITTRTTTSSTVAAQPHDRFNVTSIVSASAGQPVVHK